MKKNLGVFPVQFPMPVLIVAAYDEAGIPNAMNAAWGTICDSDKIALIIDEDHKTTKNIRVSGAFTVALADRRNMAPADFFGIATGKLRRYFDPKNFSDPFRVVKGFAQARKILKKIKPDVIFSKGGFVSVPVVRAASTLKIPCIIHESDMTPGLANKLCIPIATKICCNFPETLKCLPEEKPC